MCAYPSDNSCKATSRFLVSVTTIPQALGPNGAYGIEQSPAARSLTACGNHLTATVRLLAALPIATSDLVRVREYNKR